MIALTHFSLQHFMPLTTETQVPRPSGDLHLSLLTARVVASMFSTNGLLPTGSAYRSVGHSQVANIWQALLALTQMILADGFRSDGCWLPRQACVRPE